MYSGPFIRATAPRIASRLPGTTRAVIPRQQAAAARHIASRNLLTGFRVTDQTRFMMQAANRIKRVLDEGKTAWGAWQMIPGANVARLLAHSGVDWVLVDCEHGNIDDAAMHDAVPAIAAAGVSPIVRIPDTQGWMVKRALDAGAHGILVPLLRSVKEAEELVQASKFPPWGKRGFGSPLPPKRFDPKLTAIEYLQQANDNILTMVQIETQEALDAIDEIAAVKGIDVLFIGPFDLGNNIGYPVTAAGLAPQLKDAIARIYAATKKAGKKCGIYSVSGEQAKQFKEQGFDMVHVVTDYAALDTSVTQTVNTAKS